MDLQQNNSMAAGGTIIIACDVLRDEIRSVMQSCRQILHLEILEQGLHNDPPKLRTVLQQAIDRLEPSINGADTIVLGYGLCSRGIEGVKTQRCKLVIPRAHDCITLLLGSKERYAQYVAQHPGTYWYSPGWNRCHTPPGPQRYQKLYDQYLQKFGEEDARYLMETEQAWFSQYSRATYVDVGVAATESDVQYTKDCATWLKWDFDRQHGSPELIRALLRGDWDAERFLVLNPGQEAKMTADTQIITLNVPSKEGKHQ